VAQQPGLGVTCEDIALDTDDGGDVGCQSLSASLSAGSKTVTVRLSSRLRPLSRLWADPIGAVVAAISSIC
jgi:hypothetical protein